MHKYPRTLHKFLATNRIFTLVAFLAAVFVFICSADTPDPSQVGQWGTMKQWPFAPVHSVVLNTGKVLFWPSFDQGDNPQLYDPATGLVTATTASGHNIFCVGHSQLSDGRILLTGGHIVSNYGLANASTYDPATATWLNYPPMNEARWYPSNTTLGNGDVLVVSGTIGPALGTDTLPQVFQAATGTWRNLTTAQLGMVTYPEMYVMPDGRVFNSGPAQQTRFLNPAGTGAWTTGPLNNFGLRDYGPSVLYDTNKILLVGGGTPPTATAEIIDLSAPTPSFKYTASMSYPRRQSNATILADGKVLVTGGSCGALFDDSTCPVFSAEMWDPATGTWTVLASLSRYRGYHSTALLLPDGTVFSGGGASASGEIFSPPYLFKGARPAITSAPTVVSPQSTFYVQTPDAANIATVNLIRLGATTHTFNMDQRISHLSFHQTPNGLNVDAPPSNNIAPPGYYMLFILSSGGVPSIARIIQVTTGGIGGAVLTTNNLNFGSQLIGNVKSPLAVTVTNSNSSPIFLNSFSISGASFSISGNTCGSTLPPGGSCSVSVQFSASAAGAAAGTLTISASNPTNPQSVTLSGVGFGLQLGASNLNFPGSIPLNSSSAAIPLNLTNVSGAPISISGINFSNPEFVSGTGTSCGTTLMPSASCFVNVVFTPTSGGQQAGTLTITDSDPASPQIISLVGWGGTGLTIYPATLTFPTTPVGQAAPAQLLTLSNSGPSVLNFSSYIYSNPQFSRVSSVTTCGATLAVSASCVVAVTFKPTSNGIQNSVLRIQNNDPSSPQDVSLTGVSGAVSLVVSPSSVGFPPTNPGFTSSAQSVVLTNSGSSLIAIKGVTLPNPQFTYGTNSTCGPSLPASASCIMSLLFTPTAFGVQNGTIGINDSDPSSPTVVTLTGTGSGGPSISLSPASLAFPSRTQNLTGPSLSTTLTNSGVGTFVVNNISLSGANPDSFAISSNSCGTQVPPGSNCSISATFTPLTFGNLLAAIVVDGNAPDGLKTVSLTGTGKPALVSIAITPLNPVIQSGGTLQFTAIGTYADNSTQNVTSSVNWYTSSTGVATINKYGSTGGLATGVSAGTSTIKASYSSGSTTVTASTLLTVNPK